MRTVLRVKGLSRAEILVSEKVIEGKTNKEIGSELCVSEKTVKFHLTSIYKKLGVSSRNQHTIFINKLMMQENEIYRDRYFGLIGERMAEFTKKIKEMNKKVYRSVDSRDDFMMTEIIIEALETLSSENSELKSRIKTLEQINVKHHGIYGYSSHEFVKENDANALNGLCKDYIDANRKNVKI